jgi:hypothetical protein
MVGDQDNGLREEAQRIGFHLVERPSTIDPLEEFVRKSLGEPVVQTKAVSVPMDLTFLLEQSKGTGGRAPRSNREIPAVPVEMDFAFLMEQSKGAGNRQAPRGTAVEAVPVRRALRFMSKSTEIAGKRRLPADLPRSLRPQVFRLLDTAPSKVTNVSSPCRL